MVTISDKVMGITEQAIGAAKQVAGKVIGNPDLEVKGAMQKLKGEAQRAFGETKQTLNKVIEKI